MGASDWSIPGADGEPIIGNTHRPGGGARGVVIVAHGFKGYKDYGMFPRIAQTMADEGFVAHRFNFSHSGMTDEIDRFARPDLFERDTWNKQVFDLRGVIAAVTAGKLAGQGLPYVLFGHSRGGAAALLFGGRHGAGGERGVPAPAGVVSASAPSGLDVLAEDQRQLLLEQGWLESPSSRTGQALRIGREFLLEQLRDPAGHDLLRLAARIACPVLIVHGRADVTVPDACALQLAAAMGERATLRLVEGADHVYNTPNPLPEGAPSSPQFRELVSSLAGFAGRCCGAGSRQARPAR